MNFNIKIGLLILITNSRINNIRFITDQRKRFIFFITTKYIDALSNVVLTWEMDGRCRGLLAGAESEENEAK